MTPITRFTLTVDDSTADVTCIDCGKAETIDPTAVPIQRVFSLAGIWVRNHRRAEH